jgi:cysteinyl-tRNA synthetase
VIPDDIRALAALRQEARTVGDYVRADALREQLRARGYEVVDAPGGPELRPIETAGPPTYAASEDVPTLLDSPPECRASIQWVVQGWPEDVARGIESFRRHCSNHSIQQVVVDATGLGSHEWPADVVRFAPQAGWAAARNAGLRRSAGEVVVVVEGSVEATGDVVAPLLRALDDPAVGITGPFGIVTEDLREFHESAGPDVDAVEGYLMAFRRGLVQDGLRFDERFKFYRTADIELTFQVKAKGLRATVTPVPLERHEHRVWANTDEAERARLSKRNFYRFLDRWRGRSDLLVGNRR